ncbi:hypothetical protein [Nonomuraea sp. LPB2021202275-12-8]|uniref:hypothetical protein n=1 Tax=Nonomuraea sp. LPB2021202275-12-8 TaxID=3120159 RepID=UPI00300C2ABC
MIVTYYWTRDRVVVTGGYTDRPESWWTLTFRDREAPFDPSVEMTLSYGQLAALTDWPEVFTAWRQHQPETLKDLAVLLDYLGVADVTEERERQRRQADWTAMLLMQGEEIEDGPGTDDPSDLPPEPHPDDEPPDEVRPPALPPRSWESEDEIERTAYDDGVEAGRERDDDDPGWRPSYTWDESKP